MNIKLHTPKSLKMGSGMSSLKQFLLSVVATSISIALTFGTAAIIDNKKKQGEKREIVMMVMYDMYTSLESIEKSDSMIRQSMEIQRQLAEDTTLFEKLRYQMAHLMPKVEYTETTERIFSSSIESINTVGNVLFTENVADFYRIRQQYKTMICDSIEAELRKTPIFYSIKEAIGIEYSYYGIASIDILGDMQHLFAECKQMMDVTDKELEAYQKQREQIKKALPEDEKRKDSIKQNIIEFQKKMYEVNKQLKLEE